MHVNYIDILTLTLLPAYLAVSGFGQIHILSVNMHCYGGLWCSKFGARRAAHVYTS